MAKPGRRTTKVQLETKEDPALWQYDSRNSALKANVGILAELIAAQRAKVPQQTTAAYAPTPPSVSQPKQSL